MDSVSVAEEPEADVLVLEARHQWTLYNWKKWVSKIESAQYFFAKIQYFDFLNESELEEVFANIASPIKSLEDVTEYMSGMCAHKVAKISHRKKIQGKVVLEIDSMPYGAEDGIHEPVESIEVKCRQSLPRRLVNALNMFDKVAVKWERLGKEKAFSFDHKLQVTELIGKIGLDIRDSSNITKKKYKDIKHKIGWNNKTPEERTFIVAERRKREAEWENATDEEREIIKMNIRNRRK